MVYAQRWSHKGLILFPRSRMCYETTRPRGGACPKFLACGAWKHEDIAQWSCSTPLFDHHSTDGIQSSFLTVCHWVGIAPTKTYWRIEGPYQRPGFPVTHESFQRCPWTEKPLHELYVRKVTCPDEYLWRSDRQLQGLLNCHDKGAVQWWSRGRDPPRENKALEGGTTVPPSSWFHIWCVGNLHTEPRIVLCRHEG